MKITAASKVTNLIPLTIAAVASNLGKGNTYHPSPNFNHIAIEGNTKGIVCPSHSLGVCVLKNNKFVVITAMRRCYMWLTNKRHSVDFAQDEQEKDVNAQEFVF